MKKLIVFAVIFTLIVSTSLIKNSTKDLDDQIYSLRENILFLENRFNDSKLEFDYLSSSEKLLEYQKLYFENLLINNFGVYCGKQNFDLTTKSKKPVILIGALNGSGKTTFLQAIDFVLYGKFSNYFYSQKLSYDNFLNKNINKKNFDEGAQIELTFNRKYKGKKQKFKISRNWKLIGKKMKEEFFVFIDEKFDEDITKDWDNFVDQILPSRVASLFFFDGEKIEQLADLEESKKVLKKAINSLLIL